MREFETSLRQQKKELQRNFEDTQRQVQEAIDRERQRHRQDLREEQELAARKESRAAELLAQTNETSRRDRIQENQLTRRSASELMLTMQRPVEQALDVMLKMSATGTTPPSKSNAARGDGMYDMRQVQHSTDGVKRRRLEMPSRLGDSDSDDYSNDDDRHSNSRHNDYERRRYEHKNDREHARRRRHQGEGPRDSRYNQDRRQRNNSRREEPNNGREPDGENDDGSSRSPTRERRHRTPTLQLQYHSAEADRTNSTHRHGRSPAREATSPTRARREYDDRGTGDHASRNSTRRRRGSPSEDATSPTRARREYDDRGTGNHASRNTTRRRRGSPTEDATSPERDRRESSGHGRRQLRRSEDNGRSPRTIRNEHRAPEADPSQRTDSRGGGGSSDNMGADYRAASPD